MPSSSFRLNWLRVFLLTCIHLMCLAALATLYFSWVGLIACVVGILLTGNLGVCLGYHRLLTHRSFETYPPVRWALAFFGTLAGEGSTVHWVAVHRKHHQYSDEEEDPHSPLEKGFWWSHVGWALCRESRAERRQTQEKYAKDLLADPVIRMLDRTYILWHLLAAVGLFLLGWQWDLHTAWSCVIWGMGVRLTFVLHGTWTVNSVTHLWGSRRYDTPDHSRNNWVIALITGGEGWHNNHHADQNAANHGRRWWEFDPTYLTICLMRWVGLARNVKKAH